MNYYEQKLKAYGEEAYSIPNSFSPLTLDELIDSHRSFRALVKKYREEWTKTLTEAQEMGRQQGYQAVTNDEYFHRDALKAMTMLEISNLLTDVEY